MGRKLLIAFVTILFSANAIYASFPVIKSIATNQKKFVNKDINVPITNHLTEMESVSSTSVRFKVTCMDKVVTPKRERFVLSKQLLKNKVGVGFTPVNDGWSIFSILINVLVHKYCALAFGNLTLK